MIENLILLAVAIYLFYLAKELLVFILRIIIEIDYVHYPLFRRSSIMDLEDKAKNEHKSSDKTWRKLAKLIKKEKKISTNGDLSDSFRNLRKKHMMEIISASLYEKEMQFMIQANIDAINGISIEKIKKNNPIFSRTPFTIYGQIERETDEWFKEWEERPADYSY